ncbi:MAG: DUF4382 domain-containing protein [Bdellovibrionales bacterium]
MKKQIRSAMYTFGIASLLLLFQNCSDVNFSSAGTSPSLKGGGNTILDTTQTTSSTDSDSDSGDLCNDIDNDLEEDNDIDSTFMCNASNVADVNVNILQAFADQTPVQILTGVRSLKALSMGFNIITTVAFSASQIRLELAPTGNQIVDSLGNLFNIKTPSGQQSGLKINLQGLTQFNGNTAYTITFAFDPLTQIVSAGNQCLLKPVFSGATVTEVIF